MAGKKFRSPKPHGSSGGSFLSKIIDFSIATGNGAVSLLSGLLATVLIAYSGYVIYDTVSIQQQASSSSWNLMQFKPQVIDDEDAALAAPSLMDINSDYRAWLTVHNTVIDYPVMQGKDDLYYASHDIYGNSSLSGAIYLAAGNSGNFSDSYNLLYGHHMDSGAMFGSLDSYTGRSYFNSHRTAILVTPDTIYDVEFFAVLSTDAYESRIYSVGNRLNDVLAFIASGGEGGVGVGTKVLQYDPATAAGAIKLLALSTCASAETSGRLVVIGRMIARNMKRDLTVVKVWRDGDNQDGLRPAALRVTLLADGQPVSEVRLSEANRWRATAKDMPIYKDGKEITYTWKEPTIKGYRQTSNTTETANDGSAVTTLTNTHEPVTVDLTIQKIWVDDDNIHGNRPDHLNMILTGGDVTRIVTLNEGNEWTATVTGLPGYRNGEPIVYTWTEPAIPGYTQTGIETVDTTTIFTNTWEGEPEEDEYTLTIYYRYQDGSTAAETHESIHKAGDEYDVISPVIPGYRATLLRVTGVMPARNMVYTVIYIPDNSTIIDDPNMPLGLGQVFINLGDCIE